MAGRMVPITEEHRVRLVRRLRQRIGPFWAEDLAQETLIAAWANPNTPDREPDLTRWLFAIARNLAATRLRAEVATSPIDTRTIPAVIDEWDGNEWAGALETGMSVLPAETRSAISLRYLDGMSQMEAAGRLGMSEGALESRIQRGKRAIQRHLLAGDGSMAVELGLVAPTGTWIPTTIWCDSCGRQRLEGMWLEGGGFRLDCPSCATLGGARNHNMSVTAPIATGLTRFGTAIRRLQSRTLAWANEGVPPPACPFCSAPTAVVPESVDGQNIVQFAVRCTSCPHPFWMSAHGLAGSTNAFNTWRKSQWRVATPGWPITIKRPGETWILVQWRGHTDASTFEALVDPTLRQPIRTSVTDARGLVLR